jgi:hypothetical protein
VLLVVYLSYSSIAAWVLCVSLGVYSVYVRSVNLDLLHRYQKHSMHSIASIFRVANDDRLIGRKIEELKNFVNVNFYYEIQESGIIGNES